ncbi:MAG: ChbG/HpnK family deacetylase [Elusimicrobia bacterium]|nr:ChbG/HpnK family deacetylase [Elusimicrobiota bacterium]
MKKLIINADDFGYRESINKGIIYAHKNGYVTSASLFVEKEATDNAVALAKENPSLGLGIHLDLDKYFEVDHSEGIIKHWINPKPLLDDVFNEAKRQIEKYLSFGFSADHIDSHHHAHMHHEIFPLICKAAKDFNIKVIRLFPKADLNDAVFEKCKNAVKDHNLKHVDHFIEGWYWGNVDEAYQIAELMTHPGYGELWREAELAHCCQPELKQYFIDKKIDLLRFSDIF